MIQLENTVYRDAVRGGSENSIYFKGKADGFTSRLYVDYKREKG